MSDNYENNNYTEQNSMTNANQKKNSWMDGNSEMIKLLSVALCSFLGAFLAIVLFGRMFVSANAPVQSQTFTPHQIEHQYKNIDNFFNEDEWVKEINRDFEFMSPKIVMPIANHKLNIVKFEENDDNYKVTINLKQFHDNEKNVIVDVKPHSIKISGKASTKTNNEQSSFSYMQELPLYKKVDVDDVKKERIDNNYIITLPFED